MLEDATRGEYWERLWHDGSEDWHRGVVNERLIKFANELTRGRKNLRVLVPCCGKSLDMLWLADQGHSVVGIDLVKTAIESFFTENNLTSTKCNVDMAASIEQTTEVYKCVEKAITIFCCDIFNVREEDLGGKFDAIWDRSALSAVSPMVNNRGKQFTDKLHSLLMPDGVCMVESHRYEMDRFGEPPVSLSEELIYDLYGERFLIKWLDAEKLQADKPNPLEIDTSFDLEYHYYLFTPKNN